MAENHRFSLIDGKIHRFLSIFLNVAELRPRLCSIVVTLPQFFRILLKMIHVGTPKADHGRILPAPILTWDSRSLFTHSINIHGTT